MLQSMLSSIVSYCLRGLLWIAFAEHQNILVCLAKFSSGIELSGNADGQGTNSGHKDRAVVKASTGGFERLNCVGRKVPIETIPVANVANNKASKTIKAQHAYRSRYDLTIHLAELRIGHVA